MRNWHNLFEIIQCSPFIDFSIEKMSISGGVFKGFFIQKPKRENLYIFSQLCGEQADEVKKNF
jgi:hypothetical protein